MCPWKSEMAGRAHKIDSRAWEIPDRYAMRVIPEAQQRWYPSRFAWDVRSWRFLIGPLEIPFHARVSLTVRVSCFKSALSIEHRTGSFGGLSILFHERTDHYRFLCSRDFLKYQGIGFRPSDDTAPRSILLRYKYRPSNCNSIYLLRLYIVLIATGPELNTPLPSFVHPFHLVPFQTFW